MAKQPAVSDATLTKALAVYAGMVRQVLDNPQRWLGGDDEPAPTPTCPPELSMRSRTAPSARPPPAHPSGPSSRYSERVDWWVDRIGIVGGLAAAAPRFAGALADRVPLQAALGASAAGLAVCAVAREHGRTTAAEWVPLLARVLFDRDLSPQAAAVPAPGGIRTTARGRRQGHPRAAQQDGRPRPRNPTRRANPVAARPHLSRRR